MNPDPTRRVFIQRTTEAAALLTAASTLGAVHGFAADQPATVRLGIIGCGGIMGHHLKGLVGRREAVSLAWLCDVDPAQIEKAARLIDGFQPAPRSARPASKTCSTTRTSTPASSPRRIIGMRRSRSRR